MMGKGLKASKAGRGIGHVRKAFFSEEKNQETFASGGGGEMRDLAGQHAWWSEADV
jgi:hypothetical protein